MRHARWLLWLGLALPGLAGAQSAAATPARGDATFAVVGQQVITVSEFQQALNVAMRKKYYHAKPPEHEVAQFQRVVGDDLVNRTLLVAEARRRGLQPDRARIDATLRDYEARYKGSKNWEAGKDRMTAAVTQQLESDSLLEQLERQVRQVRAPTEKDARAFYEANKALFVEPEQVKLSVILLTVDPSSPQAAWNAAHAEAKAIHARLLKGASFAELARLHSGDISATRSGDMGYVHRGMLPDAVNTTVDPLQPGAGVPPARLCRCARARRRPLAARRGRGGMEGADRRPAPDHHGPHRRVPLPATGQADGHAAPGLMGVAHESKVWPCVNSGRGRAGARNLHLHVPVVLGARGGLAAGRTGGAGDHDVDRHARTVPFFHSRAQ
ncbi:MAG: peptidylprolyl isomerase [Burkholderiaceae bacterium]|nr:peptidylprolyl isomerase [Burkholderiaceae bacterium]